VKLLITGYTTLKQAKEKGIVTDNERSYNLWYNPGRNFESTVFIPFGKEDMEIDLTPKIKYIERKFDKSGFLPWATFKHLSKSIREVRNLPADVLRINGPHIPAIVGMFVSLPKVMFIEAFWEDILHDQKFPSWIKFLLPYWYRLQYKLCDVYCGTPSIVPDYYISRGMDKNKIGPWCQELDLEGIPKEECPSEIKGLPSPRIVAVGRLHREKLPADLVKMMNIIKRGTLILVGDGEERDNLIILAKELNVNLYLTGKVSQGTGLAIVKECDIYAAPMQGNALVEAMSTGIPIVAYDHHTHKQLLQEILVPHLDIEAMAEKVKWLLDNPKEAKEIGERTKKAAWERFSPDVVNKTLSASIIMAKEKASG
jgi:glycosyltransferase involved in cell wall biosynthesis